MAAGVFSLHLKKSNTFTWHLCCWLIPIFSAGLTKSSWCQYNQAGNRWITPEKALYIVFLVRTIAARGAGLSEGIGCTDAKTSSDKPSAPIHPSVVAGQCADDDTANRPMCQHLWVKCCCYYNSIPSNMMVVILRCAGLSVLMSLSDTMASPRIIYLQPHCSVLWAGDARVWTPTSSPLPTDIQWCVSCL